MYEVQGPFVSCFWCGLKESGGPLFQNFWSSLKESREIHVGLIVEVISKNLRDSLYFIFEVASKKSWKPLVFRFKRNFNEFRVPIVSCFEVVWKNPWDPFSQSSFWSSLREFQSPAIHDFVFEVLNLKESRGCLVFYFCSS